MNNNSTNVASREDSKDSSGFLKIIAGLSNKNADVPYVMNSNQLRSFRIKRI